MQYIVVLGALMFISACGFTPTYAVKQETIKQQAAVPQQLNNIDIALIPDREGVYLRNSLIDRFYKNGYPSDARYQLIISPIKENISNFDITVFSEATRRQLKLTTSMRLLDRQTQEPVLQRSLSAVTSNNVLQSEFSTRVTEQSARESALNDLARQIEQHIALYFN